MADEVKLLGVWASPYTHRVELALKLKGIKYEVIDEDLSNKSPLLLKSNPVHKKTPVLLHNGKPICESLVIVEYIDETWKGNPILPQDPYERAVARFWAKYIDEKCLSALYTAYWTEGEEQKKAQEEGYEFLKILENHVKDKKLFGGERIGLQDIGANFIAHWAEVLQQVTGVEMFTKDKFPNLYKWMEKFISCSVVKENQPPRDKLIAYFKARFQASVASKN